MWYDVLNTVLHLNVHRHVKGAAVLVILSKSKWNESEQTSNLPRGPMGPAHSTVTVPYSSRWPVEVAMHSQTTLAWPPMSLFLLRIWNQLPLCIFELVFSLKEWAGHKTPPEYCCSHTTVEWQFKELKAIVWLSELFQMSLSLWKQTQKLLDIVGDEGLKHEIQYHVEVLAWGVDAQQ